MKKRIQGLTFLQLELHHPIKPYLRHPIEPETHTRERREKEKEKRKRERGFRTLKRNV